MHHLGFQLSFKGLHLTQNRKTARRAAHLVLELMEDFVQPLGSGPKGGVVLSRCGIHVHGGSVLPGQHDRHC
jgi:hypothetical protein